MQFIPFKGIKRVSVNISSLGQSTIYTTTADSLIFVNAYNTSGVFLYDFAGHVWWESGNNTIANNNRVCMWVGNEANDRDGLFRLGAGGGGSYVSAGENIYQDNIYSLGAGSIDIDLYILELNDQIVPSS